MADFSDFGAFDGGVQETESISVRPQDDMVVLKHDARTGTMQLLLSGHPDPQNANHDMMIDIQGATFNLVIQRLTATGTEAASQPTAVGMFNVYRDRQNLGIFNRQNMWNETMTSTPDGMRGVSTVTRNFGILTQIDGKSIAEHPVLSQLYPGMSYLPIMIALSWGKQKVLNTVAGANATSGTVLINMQGGKSSSYQREIAGGKKVTYYNPVLAAAAVSDGLRDDMLSQPNIQEFMQNVKAWADKIKENDTFLSYLFANQLRGANTVPALADMGITSVDTLDERLLELGNNNKAAGAAELRAMIATSSQAAAQPAQPQGDPFAGNNQAQANAQQPAANPFGQAQQPVQGQGFAQPQQQPVQGAQATQNQGFGQPATNPFGQAPVEPTQGAQATQNQGFGQPATNPFGQAPVEPTQGQAASQPVADPFAGGQEVNIQDDDLPF